MDIVSINVQDVKKNQLTIQEYMTLMYIYQRKIKEYEEFISCFGSLFQTILNSLESKGFIKLIKAATFEESVHIRDKTKDLFEGEKDLFYEWLGKFPIKTPSGRYLSPKSETTIAGVKLRKKWDKLFKNKASMARKAINVLEAEMEWRRKQGKFEFMHNAETWLNQGDFEKYEDLLTARRKEKDKLYDNYN